MPDVDIVPLISQTGFPIAVAAFLLWKGYTQDKEFLEILQKLSDQIADHTKTKDESLAMLKQLLQPRT